MQPVYVASKDTVDGIDQYLIARKVVITKMKSHKYRTCTIRYVAGLKAFLEKLAYSRY